MNYIQYMQTPFQPIGFTVGVPAAQQAQTGVQKLRLVGISPNAVKNQEEIIEQRKEENWEQAKKEGNIITETDRQTAEIQNNRKEGEKSGKFRQRENEIRSEPRQLVENLDPVQTMAGYMTPGIGSLMLVDDASKSYRLIGPALKYGQYAPALGNLVKGTGELALAASSLVPGIDQLTDRFILGRTKPGYLYEAPTITKRTSQKPVSPSADEIIKDLDGQSVSNQFGVHSGQMVNGVPVETYKAYGKTLQEAKQVAIDMYSPGGAWYQRQLANGVPKQEVEKLAATLRENVKNATTHVRVMDPSIGAETTLSLSGNVQNPVIVDVASNPASKYGNLIEVPIHEFGHASTLNGELRMPVTTPAPVRRTMQTVLNHQKELVPLIEHNEGLLPLKRRTGIPNSRYTAYTTSQQEIRQRAFAAEADAMLKGVSLDTYINTPSLWGENLKELMNIYEFESVRNFVKNYKAILPAVGTTGATVSAIQAGTDASQSLKQGGSINYLNYSK